MPKKISVQYDHQKIPIIGLVAESTASAPSSPVNGQFYYDTVATRGFIREAGAWVLMSQTGTEKTANKGIASGYASLDGSVKVPIAQIPTGTTGSTVPFGNDSRFSDTRTPTDGTVTGGPAGAGVKIAVSTITIDNIAAALQNAAAGTTSLRQLGTSSTQAFPGNGRIDQLAVPTAPVSFNSQEITNVGAPTGPNSGARLLDIQNAQAGIDNKPSVRFIETVNRAALTGLTVDGSARTDGDRVLLVAQTTGSQNGPWIIHSGAWLRPAGETITSGAFWLVTEGTGAGQQWKVATPDPIVLDTTSLSITQWGAGSTYTGTTNRITVTGGAIDISTAYVGQATITTLGTVTTGVWTGTTIAVANGGTGATSAAGAKTNLGFTVGYTAALAALTAGVELNVVHSLNTSNTIESFKIVADGTKTDLGVRTIDANTIGVTSDVTYGASAIQVTVVGF